MLGIKEKQKRHYFERFAATKCLSSRELEEEIKKDKFNIRRLIQKYEPAEESVSVPRLNFVQGRLYTYKIIEPEYIHPVEGNIVVDCGFEVNIEVPIKGITKPKEDEVIESIKTKDGYIFKESDANKNQLYTYRALVERLVDADTLCPPIRHRRIGETSPKSYVLHIYFN